MNTSKNGLPAEKTRATFILTELTVEKIKDIAYWERLGINELVENVLAEHIKKYEKKTGPVKSRNKKASSRG